jgi:hypothetical protein
MPNVNPTMHPKSDREGAARLSRSDIIHRSVFLDNNPAKPSEPFVRNPATPDSIGRNNTLKHRRTIVVINTLGRVILMIPHGTIIAFINSTTQFLR